MNDDIMVSICCLVYNHEKYLRQCLDGFMMQKTSFRFEVLIHDDASTDHSADIIREYEEKYPDIIKPIYQTENQHSKGVKISWVYQYPRASGKYIAHCEGDDYWTDPHKLQKQFDAMEKNPDCVFCTHIVDYVSENGDSTRYKTPADTKLKKRIPSEEWIRMILSSYSFQTSSYFFRTSALKRDLDKHCIPHFVEKACVGDTPLKLYLACQGDCLYINEPMSCYRMMAAGSWSERVLKDQAFHLNVEYGRIEMLKEYDIYTDQKYTDLISTKILQRELAISAMKKDYKSCFSPKYRAAFKKFPFRTQVSFCFFAIFPKLKPLYLKIRGKA